jgi:multidrug efflux system membrane fusion protein
VQVDVTEGTQVILKSGVNPGDQVVIDGQEKLLNGSKVTLHAQDSSGPATTGSGGESPTGPGTAAFGPGGAGPSEPADNPRKQGIEEGSGVKAGAVRGPIGTGQPKDGQPHQHHRPGQGPAQTGQQP